MLPRLALLFILVPILELAILVQLGQRVGFWPTLALVIFTGVLGASLARSAGMRILSSIRSELAAGRVPSEALQDGLAVLVGGALLLTPGLITDFAGFSLLFSPTRSWLKTRIRRWLERQVRAGRMQIGVWGTDGMVFRSGGPPPASRKLDPRNEIEQRQEE
jgi:UPF0716 protein FxsA